MSNIFTFTKLVNSKMTADSDNPAGGSSAAGGDKEAEASAFIPQSGANETAPPSTTKSRMAVPLVVLVFGLLLSALGLVAYFAFAGGEGKERSVTALIPLFWGLPIVACAVATLLADNISGRLRQKHRLFA